MRAATRSASRQAVAVTVSAPRRCCATATSSSSSASSLDPRRARTMGAFRHLLRAQERAFEGDLRTMELFRAESHKRFRDSNNKSEDDTKFEKQMSEVSDVVQFLDKQVVQGEKVQRDVKNADTTFRLKFRATSARYKHWPPPGFDEKGNRIPGVSTTPGFKGKTGGGCCQE